MQQNFDIPAHSPAHLMMKDRVQPRFPFVRFCPLCAPEGKRFLPDSAQC